MPDFGLYQALRGTDNWAQKRADKMNSLMILEKRDQSAKQKLQEQMQLEEGMNQYFDELKKLDVLEQDQDRINQLEKQQRNTIYKGLMEHNGDIKAYMSSGGISDLHTYRNSVLNSQEAKNAGMNKQMLNHYITDMSKGDKVARDVLVNVPVMNDDGSPKLDKNGEPLMVPQKMGFDQQYALFQKGIINKLNYSGAENKIDIKALDFAKYSKDPNNPFEAQPVTESDVFFKARSSGASEDYARKIAKDYAGMYAQTGNHWSWNTENMLNNQLKAAKINALGGKSKGSGSSHKEILNSIIPALQKLPEGSEMIMDPKSRDFWMEDMGLRYNGEQNAFKPTRRLGGYDAHTLKEYDLSNAMSVSPVKYVSQKGPDGKNQRFLVADVVYNADEPGANNPHAEDFFGGNDLMDDKAIHNWQEGTADQFGLNSDVDAWKGQVLIPVEDKINDQNFRQYMNQFVGLHNRTHGMASSVTNDMEDSQTMQGIQSLIDAGFDPDEAAQYYHNAYQQE